MTDTPYDNPATVAERLAVQRNDERIRKGGATYHGFAVAEADVIRGRFTAHERSTVTGSGPVAYPTLPASSPWHHDPVPASEPLGFPIDQMEPTGEAFEVAKSLAMAPDGTDGPLSVASPNGDGALLRGHSSSRLSKQRRRRPFKRRSEG